ncbi:MAG: hypothetical protein OQJ98_00595 [Candidatus Pacebacteria bacterium]|nr:hypothetical protein [Candidatus Paceibacterota bacterium]
MHKHPLFILWFMLLVMIAVLHASAIEFYLYWTYSWFDTMMHFLGGLLVGLASLWLFFESGYICVARSLTKTLLVAGGAIVIVGVGWEVFEVLAGIPIENNYVLDTTTDLAMDALGTIFAVIFFTTIYGSNQNGTKYGTK